MSASIYDVDCTHAKFDVSVNPFGVWETIGSASLVYALPSLEFLEWIKLIQPNCGLP